MTGFVWVTGLVRLMSDASTALYIILPLMAILVVIWNIVQYFHADDHEKANFKKNIKYTVIALIVGMTANGFINLLLGYFPS
ncbi:pilin [Acetobacterium bakii]|uniref:Uncharacterized protein n=1 Tax=Acetobacterium bakii TaxID=52689 RepID=A0A0L6U3Q4_9FIRM|nr:pilin [Acetobacterium bakii]KNZ42405.1 hypothetical protein AKG39_06440 [Acetobacterium bakii]